MANIFDRIFRAQQPPQQPKPEECNCRPISAIFGEFSAGAKLNISTVYRSIDLLSDSVGSMNVNVVDKNDIHAKVQHPLQDFFYDKTGALMTRFNLVKKLIMDVLRFGNAYCLIKKDSAGRCIGLQYLESGDVTIYWDKQKQDLYFACPIIGKGKIKPNDICHFYKWSNDGIVGIGVLSYATQSINIADSQEKTAGKFFKSGANLSGVLTLQGQVRQEQKEAARQAMQQVTNGGTGIAVLDNGMTYSPISVNARDSQLVEARGYSVSDIARFFGIDPMLLGDINSKSSYKSLEEALRNLFTLTVKPFVTMLETELTRKCLSRSEMDIYAIKFDTDTLLKSDNVSMANYLKTLVGSGILCINEGRALLDLPEIQGGDKHVIAFSDINQNTINNESNNI